MKSGPLRFRVILERRVDTQDDGGQVVHTYEEIARVRAAIQPISGREYFAAAQIQSEVNTRIIIRWRNDVDETCRARHVRRIDSPIDQDIYDIAAVLPDEKTGRRQLTLMCIKRNAEGWRRGPD